MYASTDDDRMKQRADYIVAELHACQAQSGNGLVCAFPDGATQLENAVAGRKFVGVPWYTMHKILSGLRDAHLHTGSAAALEVLRKLADWTLSVTAPMTDEQFQRMLATEHGGMNEVLADVSALTADPKYLTLARRFTHEALLTPLSDGRDTLDGLHANTQIPKVVGFQRLAELTGEDRYRRAARFFWQTVVEQRSFATGGHGDGEHFFPVADVEKHLQSAKTMETCCTHNMLRLTRLLFQDEPSAAYFDYYERALYNGILASQDPETGMMTYFQATRPGYVRLYHTPDRSFWCCTGHRHGEPREVRRLDLLPRQRRSLDQSLCRVRRDLDGQRADAATGDRLSGTAVDAFHRQCRWSRARHPQCPASRLVHRHGDTGERPTLERHRWRDRLRHHRSRVAIGRSRGHRVAR